MRGIIIFVDAAPVKICRHGFSKYRLTRLHRCLHFLEMRVVRCANQQRIRRRIITGRRQIVVSHQGSDCSERKLASAVSMLNAWES